MTISITPLLAHLSEASNDLGYFRVYCDFNEYMLYKKWLREDNVTFIEGQDSLYCLNTRKKYILKTNCTYWPDEDGELILMTPGEIARIELSRNFPGHKTFYKKEYLEKLLPLLDISPPNFYDGNVYEDVPLYYIDLKGAYWQVYSYLSLDLAWKMGQGVKSLWPIAQKLAGLKLARNSVVGITRSYKMAFWKDGDSYYKRFINPYFNPAIWATVQGVMHELAWTARLHGACYIATDGYIFDNSFNYGWFQAYLDDNGFNYHTEQGEGYLTGWASYSVGKKQTKVKRYLPGKHLDNIKYERGFVEWLKKQRKRFHYRSIIGEA